VSDFCAVRDLEKTLRLAGSPRANITVSVPAEKNVASSAPDGAGKTTFINMITGHLTPTQGQHPVRG